MVKHVKHKHKCKKKVALVIPVLIWYYPGNTGIYPDIYPGIYPGILGILGTPVFLDLPLATLHLHHFHQEVAAADAVMQFAIHRLGFLPRDILVYGWSIGGQVVRWPGTGCFF